MTSSLWIAALLTYLLLTLGVFLYAQKGLIFTLEQSRLQSEIAKTYAKNLSDDRDHDIEELRKKVAAMQRQIDAISSAER